MSSVLSHVLQTVDHKLSRILDGAQDLSRDAIGVYPIPRTNI